MSTHTQSASHTHSMRLLACIAMSALIFPKLSLAAPEVITLEHYNSDTFIAAIRPLLDDDIKLSGLGQQLIVDAPINRIEKVYALIQQLDVPPKSLHIELQLGTARKNTTQQRQYSTKKRDPYAAGYWQSDILENSAWNIQISERSASPTSIQLGSFQLNTEQRPKLQRISLKADQLIDQVRLNIQYTLSLEKNNRFIEETQEKTRMIPLNQWVALQLSEPTTQPNTHSSTTLSTQRKNDTIALSIRISSLQNQ